MSAQPAVEPMVVTGRRSGRVPSALQRRVPANEHIIEQAAIAHACAQELAGAGALLERIEIAGRNPVVWIAAPPPGLVLPVATKVSRMMPATGGVLRIRATFHAGCQVQWRDESTGDRHE